MQMIAVELKLLLEIFLENILQLRAQEHLRLILITLAGFEICFILLNTCFA